MNAAESSIPVAHQHAGAAAVASEAHCRCAHRAPSSPILDWHRLGCATQAAATTTAAGILKCAGAVAAAVPHVAAFYATAMAIRAIAASVSSDSVMLNIIRLEPFPKHRVCGLAALYATAYGIDTISQRRARRGLSTALVDTLSRAMRTGAVIATASCAMGSMIARSPSFLAGVRWCAGYLTAYKQGLLDGVALGATVAVATTVGVILFQSPSVLVARLRRAMASAIDTDLDAAETHHAPDGVCRSRLSDLRDEPCLMDVAGYDSG
ncbi:hypothetical protein psal_cds_703 [Pandoravirus salinus]|uniref:Uncharacterized protein n=1 Tax=Pandoravirus salinus TaxID=1349410 RepID=S4VYV4_9VIRU|nr:hypothetical protein psal_cds_703 [Pandoravirus salinus]AGO84661.1 hypothetical protein psal_cds_703 [Pandoravirus salinus]